MITASHEIAASDTGCGEALTKHLYDELVGTLGGTYASVLGINLASLESSEVFKWFLASLLSGARISGKVAMKTYKEFEKAGVLSPEAIFEAGWSGLVNILDCGGYTRYDFKTATKLLVVTGALMEKYEGDLNRLHFFAKDERDLEEKLRCLGWGIGPVTVAIFLRELRGLWEKAEPALSGFTLLSLLKLGLAHDGEAAMALDEMKKKWEARGWEDGSFPDLEASLMRLGRNYCSKNRCSPCPMKEYCRN